MEEGRLADNIVYFARALRAAGLPVGPGAVIDAIQALYVAHVGNRDDVYWTLHAVFVKKHEHSVIFDQAFRIFFRRRGLLEKMLAAMLPETMPQTPKSPEAGAQRIQDALFSSMSRGEEEREIEVDARLTVSAREGAARPHGRHAAYLAREPERRWRADRFEISRTAREGAADCRAARHLRLDEPVHAAVPAFSARDHRAREACRDLPVRHAAA